jgi:predicted nucleic acid-binding protein
MLLIDTSVLIFAAGDPHHPLKRPAVELVRRIVAGDIRATATPEVLQEFMHVRSRRRSRDNAVGWVERFAALLSPLLIVDEPVILRAATEFAARLEIGSFDAVLVALVLEAEDLELVTADRGLLAQKDLPVLDLASFE